MTDEQKTLNDINTEINKLPPESKQKVMVLAEALREFVHKHAGEGHMAIALTCARMSAEVL